MDGPNINESPDPKCKSTTPSLSKQRLFLDYLGESSNVSESARRAKINAGHAYKLRREDPEFANQWLKALWEGYTHLEMEVLRRLREGDLQTETGTKFDFANAIRLLSAHKDNAAKAQSQQRNVTAAEVRKSIDRKVEAIREQVRAEKRQKALARHGQGK